MTSFNCYNFFTFSILFLSCLVSFGFSLYSPSSSVVDLTPSTFDEKVLDSKTVWIVEFYAPWCGHCKSFAVEYQKAADALKGIVKVGAVDADAHGSLGSKFGIRGFPTVKIFVPGKSSPIDYQGPRTAKGVVDAAFRELRKIVDDRVDGREGKSKSSGGKNNVIEVTDSNFKETVLQSKEPFLLEFFAPWCGHCKNLEPIWKQVADELAEDEAPVKIGALDATVHTISANEYGIKGFPTIKLFIDGQVEDYEGGRSRTDILDYIKSKIADRVPPPEIKQITSEKTLTDSCGKAQLCVISFLPHILDCDSKCRNDYLEVLKQISEKHKKYGYLWAESVAQPKLEESLGVGGFGYPAMVALNIRKMKYSTLRGSFSVEGVHEFLRDLSYGKGSSVPVPGAKLPTIDTTDPWDGKDGELPTISPSDEL
ncbi:protein disulfide-isomerase A6 homolog [Panonychus citri]|uniref:protein disulfide-isomerase A6 homolog n=1 Tax=Panonychus citri TaxID=50023 RepID=UPI0023073005|nr:protein disulfide-isomerase A6 homolog [Panonychus citri]